jgi:ABC-type glycerol-3-phosphate transport system substrate-binding protein
MQEERMKKRYLVLIALAVLLSTSLLVTSCGNKEEAAAEPESLEGKTLSIMTFTGEFQDQGIVADFEERTGVTVDLQIIPIQDYEAKIRPLLKTGKNVPDLFVGEAAYVKEFVEAGYWEALDKAPYNADVSNQFPYAAQMGTDKDGVLRALTWQTTPAGYFYRRSLAKQYLGTDDPAEVAEYFASWDKILETAEFLKTESGGKVSMFPGIGDSVWRVFYSSRTEPWINDENELVIDSQVLDYLKISKTIRDKGYDAKLADWTGPFMDSMNKPAGEADVFVYGWPTWGLHFVLAGQEASKGDWAVVPAPSPWFWGGTWLGIYKDSPNKAAAWAFIEMLTQDEEYMEMYAKRSEDFMSNKSVVEKIKDDFASETLAGQNHYAWFYDQAQYVDGSAVGGSDYQIGIILNQLMNEYLQGAYSYDEAVQELKTRIKTAYPNVTVK